MILTAGAHLRSTNALYLLYIIYIYTTFIYIYTYITHMIYIYIYIFTIHGNRFDTFIYRYIYIYIQPSLLFCVQGVKVHGFSLAVLVDAVELLISFVFGRLQCDLSCDGQITIILRVAQAVKRQTCYWIRLN
jgi:hypothetical protein